MPNETSRLQEINTELTSILEARIAELTVVMRAAEQTTRQIVATEMEIGRYRQLQSSTGPELEQLQAERQSLGLRADELRAEHGKLTQSRDDARNEVLRLQQEQRELDGETEKLRAQQRSLEEEGEALRRENNDFKSRIRTLEENISRMKKLKEEMMLSISGLTAQMSNLAMGNKE